MGRACVLPQYRDTSVPILETGQYIYCLNSYIITPVCYSTSLACLTRRLPLSIGTRTKSLMKLFYLNLEISKSYQLCYRHRTKVILYLPPLTLGRLRAAPAHLPTRGRLRAAHLWWAGGQRASAQR